MDDAPWIRTKTERPLGQWHMPAGEVAGGSFLTACDRSLSADDLEERSVAGIPRAERCTVCQGVYEVRQQNPG